MLRLRPSELTLTAEDVEETFRRIARRKALKDAQNTSPHSPAPNGRPNLRHGPQRSVREAVTTLGDIPILRPHPQQAAHALADEDVGTIPRVRTPDSQQAANIASDVSPSRQSRYASLPRATPSVPPTPRLLRLPFRIGQSRRDSATQLTADDQAAEAIEVSSTPAHDLPEQSTDGSSQLPRDHNSPSRPRSSTSIKSTAELRGGGRSPRERMSNDVHDPEPFEHDTQATRDINLEPGTLFLRGRFANPLGDTRGLSYVFDEYRFMQSEPRRQNPRGRVCARSLSSGSAPRHQALSSSLRSRSRSGTSASADYDPFTTANLRSVHTTLPSSSQQDFGTGRRHFSSNASNVSGAYSLYELPPESRHSSSGQSASLQLSYDGAVPSRHTGGGYQSVHPAELSTANSLAPSRVPSSTPLTPYTHNSMFVPQTSAVTAVAQGLPSPLELYAEYYQQLERSRRAMLQQPFMVQQSVDGSSHLPRHHGLPIVPAAYNRSSPRELNSGRHSQQLSYLSSYPVPAHPQTTHDNGLQTGRRSAQATRANQRSSENAPVVAAIHTSRPPQYGQVQTQRAAYERLSHAQQALGEIIQLNGPRPISHNTSNQPRPNIIMPAFSTSGQPPQRARYFSSSPSVGNLSWEDGQTASPASLYPQQTPVLPPQQGSTNQSNTPYEHSGTRTHHPHIVTIRPPVRLQPPRDQPSTFLSREPARPPPTRISAPARAPISARTHRRMPLQQRDQENSGAGEDSLMRLEEAALHARYGEESQGEMMDETPPPLGRVERRMRE